MQVSVMRDKVKGKKKKHQKKHHHKKGKKKKVPGSGIKMRYHSSKPHAKKGSKDGKGKEEEDKSGILRAGYD